MTRLTTLLLFIFMLSACNAPNLIGYWERNHPHYKNIDSTSTLNPNAGDLTLFSDSTYLIKGIEKGYANTPGWHTGGDEKGTWKGSTSKLLVLYPDDYNSLLPVSWETVGRTRFKIIHLSQTELVLSTLDSTRRMRICSLINYKR